jgi:spermidine synthase
MDRRAPARLVLPYTAAMMAALLFMPAPRQAFMLGLGGASQVRFLRYHFTAARITAWESDARTIALARRHFALPGERDGVQVIHQDAHAGIAVHDGSADLILVDLFSAQGLAPLVHARALHDDCRRTLAAEGVLAANLWVESDDESLHVMAGLQDAFAGHTLVLTLPGYRNMVVLAFNGTPCLEFARLRERATELNAHTGLDYENMLKVLRQNNRSDANAFSL